MTKSFLRKGRNDLSLLRDALPPQGNLCPPAGWNNPEGVCHHLKEG